MTETKYLDNERVVYKVPAEEQTAAMYADMPEFQHPVVDGVLYIEQSKYKIGTSQNRFLTERLRACSGFVLRSDDSKTFGLFHASPLPMIDLDEADLATLQLFANGQMIEIKGSESTTKLHIFHTLEHKLGIKKSHTISTDTIDQQGINRFFHIAFKPASNEIFIARNSQRDVQIHPAFS